MAEAPINFAKLAEELMTMPEEMQDAVLARLTPPQRQELLKQVQILGQGLVDNPPEGPEAARQRDQMMPVLKGLGGM